jgi:hypothetical protein
MVIPAVDTPADASAPEAAAEQHELLPGSRTFGRAMRLDRM